MRKEHLTKEVLLLLPHMIQRGMHIAQGKPLHVLNPCFPRHEGNKCGKDRCDRVPHRTRERIAIPRRARRGIGCTACGENHGSRLDL